MYQEAGIHLDKSGYYTVDDPRLKTPSRHEGATAENILRWADSQQANRNPDESN